jgi:nickel-dependent lactate racemase
LPVRPTAGSVVDGAVNTPRPRTWGCAEAMKIELQYGRQTVSLDLDEGTEVRFLEPGAFDSPPADRLVQAALDDPIGAPGLRDIARRKERVVLIVSDKTRPTGASVFLPILLRNLEEAGVPDERTTIVLATGNHVGHSPDEIDRVLGPSVRSRVRVVDHDAGDGGSHVVVGRTTRGTPLSFDRNVVDADCVILTGAVSFHYFAGFGGGRKALLPGVASHDAILANHRLMVVGGDPDAPLHPLCANGVLAGNPIHEDMMEALAVVRPAFVFNTVVSPEGRIVAAVAGDPQKAHEAGVRTVRSLYGVPAERKAKLVIASCGGYPKDINYIQAHKSLHHAFDLVAEGGVLILLAECSQGIGSDDFLPWFSRLDLRWVGERLQREFTVNAHTAYQAMRKALSRRIILVTSLPGEEVESMGMVRAESAQAALEHARETLGRIEDVLVLPIASVTVPLPVSGCREG